MSLFQRKPPKPAGSGSGTAVGSANDNGTTATHRFTVDLARAETLAQMLAASRAASAVEVSDLLAGMYIYEWDRLSKYWNDREEIEAFLQQICQISPQRWHHWIEFYDQKRRRLEARSPWLPGRRQKPAMPKDSPVPRSDEVTAVLRRAEVITPFHDKVDGKYLPILTSESVLLSIALNLESKIGQKLAETGLNVASLQQDARNRKRAPQNWRDNA
jgi:hypothetical protein